MSSELSTPGLYTKGRLFLQFLEDLGGPEDKQLRARFEQEVLPSLNRNVQWDEKLTEAEYETLIAQIRQEIPAFLHFLTTHTFPQSPADWTDRRN